MGFRVRKSFKLAPGVRMTVTPRGVGASVGGRRGRLSVHSSGRVTQTVGIPGTGISHVKTVSSSSRTHPSTGHGAAPTPERADTAGKIPVPGFTAPRWERHLHKALSKHDFSGVVDIAQSDPRARHSCMFVDAMLAALPAGDYARAKGIVEALWAEQYDPAADPFVNKYLPHLLIGLGIAEGVTVSLPAERDSIGLLLGEMLQSGGDAKAAADIVEQVSPSTVAAVSLAELYAELGRWDEVVDLTNDVANEDEAATFLLIQRGIALREMSHYEAARAALRAALAPRSRPAELRRLALVERGQTYLAEGKKAMARKDFERVLAEDASYPGLQEHLAGVASD